MRYTIPQGQHEAKPSASCLHFGKTTMRRMVLFTESCRYTLPDYNKLDVNKLFGLSFGLLAVHKNSARFGWYYDPADDTIVLVAYCYVDGKRNQDSQLRFPEVARLQLGKAYYCYLTVEKSLYRFTVTDGNNRGSIEVPHGKLPSYGLTHGLYFGGTQVAPHQMELDLLEQ